MKKIFSKPYWYLVFFATYPVLALLGSNIREVKSDVVYRPLLISILFATLVLGVAWLILRERTKAALVATLFIFVFFTYGHVYEIARHYGFMYYFGGPHVLLGVLSLVLFLFGARYILKAKDHANLIRALTLIGAFLILYPLIQIGIFHSQQESAPAPLEAKTQASQGPDIYYIILDGYSRQDSIEAFGGDNTGFIKGLEDTGFYVASCSRSNYRGTLLSLTSSLNLDYIYNAIPHNGRQTQTLNPFITPCYIAKSARR